MTIIFGNFLCEKNHLFDFKSVGRVHNCHAAAQVNAPQIQNQAAVGPAPKAPTIELKPEKLANDSSMANYRSSWGKQFRAYFDAGRFDALPCTQQQPFLNNCLDDILCAHVNREALATTPVYSNIPGFMTCSSILDSVFLESNPIHLRRKQFFDARQKEGQTIIEFREELLSLPSSRKQMGTTTELTI